MDLKTSWSVVDAVDHKGFPADRSRTGGWVPAALILVIEISERLSTMGIAVNLVTYLVGTMHLPSATSANIVSDFMGTSYLLCLLGGFVADSFLGRYRTILIFALVQAVGTGSLAISTKLPQLRPPPCNPSATLECKRANGLQMAVLYISLYIIALGTGGLKSSVSGFGTDQFDEKDEKEKTQMTFFFNRFVFFISLGTLLAVTVLVYIQDEVGRSWAYGICSLSMFLATFIFLSGTRKYRYKKSSGSPIVHILQVIAAALRKRNLPIPPSSSYFYETASGPARIQHTDQFSFLDKAAIVENDSDLSNVNPWKLCSVSQVEEVKMMIKLLPIWSTTLMFWTTYAQMITFSVEQATTMDRIIGSFRIPAASLTVFFVGAVLVTLAIYDRLIMPLWRRWKGQPGFSHLQRMGIGLAFSIVAMAAAALTETKRLSLARSIGQRDRATPLPITVFALIPQFILVGAGESFIYTGQLDFFITQSPKGMKTMSTGLFLTTLSLGFFISSFLVSLVKRLTTSATSQGWLADDINRGRLDCFYGLLSALSLINFGVYLVVATWYKPRPPSHDVQMESMIKKSTTIEEKC